MQVYCLRCLENVHLEQGKVTGHIEEIPWVDPETRQRYVDIDLCELPMGYAPEMPDFDLQGYIDREGGKIDPELLNANITLDQETDGLVEEQCLVD